MLEFVMMKGLPGSGKSTRAAGMIAKWRQDGLAATRVNRDLLREMDFSDYGGRGEKRIIATRDNLLSRALDGLHCVVSDDTNLNPKNEAFFRQLASGYGAKFSVEDLTSVPLEECIQRDFRRDKRVGHKVIIDMWRRYLMPAPRVDERDLPRCAIVDLDGTIAHMGNHRGPFDEHLVHLDKPVGHVLAAIKGVCEDRSLEHQSIRPVFVSGRSEGCREATHAWIKDIAQWARTWHSPLFMRASGDSRCDTIVKREIFEQNIDPFYRVEAIFDDRPKVIRMWQSLGFQDRIFNVGSGMEF